MKIEAKDQKQPGKATCHYQHKPLEKQGKSAISDAIIQVIPRRYGIHDQFLSSRRLKPASLAIFIVPA